MIDGYSYISTVSSYAPSQKEEHGIVHAVLSKMPVTVFAFLVNFVGFLVVRYYLPAFVLSQKTSLKVGSIVAFCYAAFGVMQLQLMHVHMRVIETSRSI